MRGWALVKVQAPEQGTALARVQVPERERVRVPAQGKVWGRTGRLRLRPGRHGRRGFLPPLVEGKVELTHALETVLGGHCQCFAKRIFRFGRELDPQTAGEDKFVLVLPVDGSGGRRPVRQ